MGWRYFSMSLKRMGGWGGCICRGRGRWRGEVRFWGGESICLSGFGAAVLEQGPWETGVTFYGYAVVMGIWMSVSRSSITSSKCRTVLGSWQCSEEGRFTESKEKLVNFLDKRRRFIYGRQNHVGKHLPTFFPAFFLTYFSNSMSRITYVVADDRPTEIYVKILEQR